MFRLLRNPCVLSAHRQLAGAAKLRNTICAPVAAPRAVAELQSTEGLSARRRFLHSSRAARGEKVDPKNVKTKEMLSYEARQRGEITTARKVVEAGRDASYFVVILAGLGLTGLFAYSIFGELFGGSSPNAIYSKSLKRVRADDRVTLLLGDDLKAFGEEGRRGRRHHIASQEYEVDGQVYRRMRYYIQGSAGEGTVHVEIKVGGKPEYRYLFVEVPGKGFNSPAEYIVLEDNR